MSRCTGHCCELVGIPVSPSELQTERDRYRDGDKLADMLSFKGRGEYGDGRPRYFYVCRHFDRVARRCTDYENRPRMCSEYPYGNPCDEPACTLGGPDAAPDVPVSALRRRLPDSVSIVVAPEGRVA